MQHQIKIEKNQTGLPLGEILKVIDGQKYEWKLVWIYAVGKLSGRYSMLTLEDAVKNREGGLPVSWEYLNHIACSIDDAYDIVINGEFILHKAENSKEGRNAEGGDLQLELFDSSYWLLKTNDTALAQQFAALDQ